MNRPTAKKAATPNKDGEYPGIIYFYSDSTGLAANALCALLAAASNFASASGDNVVENSIITGVWFLAVGGLLQLVSALIKYRAYDHFGGTVLAFFSAYWAILGLEQLIGPAASVHWLHAALLLINLLFTTIASIVNSFYPLALGTIAISSALELAGRNLVDENDADSAVYAVVFAAGVAEVAVVVITGYGVAAAVLHGIYERQVLPGFQNAIIETSLWKRKPLRSSYSDGTWANPKPLNMICTSMGALAMGIWLYEPTQVIPVQGVASWLAVFALGLWLVSLLHCIRSEQLLSISSLCNACIYSTVAFNLVVYSGNHDSARVLNGGILLVFTAVRVLLTIFAVIEQSIILDIAVSGLMSFSLLVGSIQLLPESRATGVWTLVIFSMASTCALYSGIAELTNAIAQKELLPLGSQITRWSKISFPIKSRKKKRNCDNPNKSDSSMKSDASVIFVNDMECDPEEVLDPDSIERSENHEEKDTTIVAASEEVSAHGCMTYPGDKKLVGRSDFQTPLFLMLTGLALYALVLSVEMFASALIVFEAYAIILITQAAVVIICAARGQTSFGFCSLTFALEGILLAMTGPGTNSNAYKAITFLVGILFLQLLWLASSFHVFRLLSDVVILHCMGTLCKIIFLATRSTHFQYLGAVLFLLMGIVSFFTLSILIGSDRFESCRRLVNDSAGDGDQLCEVGLAHDREMFMKCVEILRNGGVCCIPTDTVYCLACAANRPEAIKRIYEIKSRPSEKPLSLWLSSIDDIKEVGPEGKGWGPKLFKFMDALWPGSVSLVVSRGSWLSRMGVGDAADLIGTHDSIALRVPNSTLTVSLLQETGPLAITSANPSGACDCTHHNKVDDLISRKIDFILADGPSPMTIASSVLDVRRIEEDELPFYRVGCIPEIYIWNKLRNLEAYTAPKQVFASIPQVHAESAHSIMRMIIELTNCDKWRLFFLAPSASQTLQTARRTSSWEQGFELYPGVIKVFQSGVSYYNDVGTAKSSELIVPMLYRGKVCAVLQLLNKRIKQENLCEIKSRTDDTLLAFSDQDMRTARMACELLVKTIEIRNEHVPGDLDSLDLLTFSDKGMVSTESAI